MTIFVQKFSTKMVETISKNNFEKYGLNCGIDTSEVPFTEVGTVGIYQVNVRYSKTLNSVASWDYALTLRGVLSTKSGFKTCQDAIDACIEEANKKEEIYYEKINR